MFLSHFVIDKFDFVERYLQFIRGRSIKDCLERLNGRTDQAAIIQMSVTVLVYVVCDNTLHLALMYYGQKLIEG